MTLSNKILLIIGSIITIGLLSVIVYQQIQISHRQQAIEDQVIAQKTLVDNIVRSSNQYATRDDIDKMIKENGVNLKAIEDDLSKLHASIAAVNVVTIDSKGTKANNLASTSTGDKNPNPVPATTSDPYGYLAKQQKLDLTESFGDTQVPIGTVGFSAWQQKPWDINIAPREYHLTSVVGVDENQRQIIYNKVSIKVADKDYDVNITTSKTEQVYPEAKFSWWNPRLFMGVDAGVDVNRVKGEFAPSLSLGIMSYGQYKTTPDFSILQIGLGYGVIQKTPELVLTPFTYNVGKHLPFMVNTYLGPSLMLNTHGDFSAMVGIRVGL